MYPATPTARELPTGTVTFLFSDIEGSTKLLHALGPDQYAAVLAEHRRVMREAFEAAGGVEVGTEGDSFFVAFPSATGAVEAARAVTEPSVGEAVRVRIGMHSGTPLLTDEGYVGIDIHLAARISAAGHGGQVLVSADTATLVGSDGLRDLGEHRLKDFPEPITIFQLGDERFPPLKTISNTNLPRPASSFVGRDAEVDKVAGMLQDGARLLTLTGPGGSGKTRLAIEAATTLVSEFKAGVFWIDLAPIREPALVTETIGQVLGAKDGLAAHIGQREMLLLVDNLEQVVTAAPELAALVEACAEPRLLATSRERLRVRGEVEFPVAPLADPDAVELFCARAQVEADEVVHQLCRALDNLPLALELAAARASVLSPAQILERLSSRLDLLKGGRDADPRQQTLRSTIEWSPRPAEPRRHSGSSPGWQSSAVAGRSTRPRPLQRRNSTRSNRWSTRVSFGTPTIGSGCWRRSASTRESAWRTPARRRSLRHGDMATTSWPWPRMQSRICGARSQTSGPSDSSTRTPIFARLSTSSRHPPMDSSRCDSLAPLTSSGARKATCRKAGATSRLRSLKTSGQHRPAPKLCLAPPTWRATTEIHQPAGGGHRQGWTCTGAWMTRGASPMLCCGWASTTADEDDFTKAQGYFQESAERFSGLGDDYSALFASRMLAWTYDALGDRKSARDLHEENLRRARALPARDLEASVLGALATYAADEGRVTDAAAQAADSIRIYLDLGRPLGIATELCRAAAALALAGKGSRQPASSPPRKPFMRRLTCRCTLTSSPRTSKRSSRFARCSIKLPSTWPGRRDVGFGSRMRLRWPSSP